MGGDKRRSGHKNKGGSQSKTKHLFVHEGTIRIRQGDAPAHLQLTVACFYPPIFREEDGVIYFDISQANLTICDTTKCGV